MSLNRPSVIVAIKVRPANARYDLLDLAANGALIAPIGPRTGDFSVEIDRSLVSPGMTLQARVKGASGPITAALIAWSSAFIDDPQTKEDETWVKIDSAAGSKTLLLEGDFDPYKQAAK